MIDLSVIVHQLLNAFSPVWYLIPILAFALITRLPWFKGLMGEVVINFSTKWLLDKAQYHLIKDVTLPTENGTTQIDHIIVSVFGVFVVETKNIRGWIFGNSNQGTWTQKIYRHTHKFQNPLRQNYKHVKTLQTILELNNEQIHSVIVFIGDSVFKTDMPDNVTYGGDYARYIKSKTTPVLSKEKVNEIIQKIETERLTSSLKTDFKHAQHVKNIIEKKRSETSPDCPKCGSTMMLRKVKKGPNIGKQFWGCKKFPHCRGTVKYNA